MYFGQEYLLAVLVTEFSRGRECIISSWVVLKCKICKIIYLRAASFQSPDRASVSDVSDSACTAFSIRWLAVQNAGHPDAETEIG